MRISAPTPNPNQIPPNPFPAWRLKYGVKNASGDELDSASESAEWWGWGCGGIVVAGILGEFVIAIFNPAFGSFLERWAPPICDLLIGLGVAGEIIFARIGHKFDTEFRSRSDAEVVDANERARLAEHEAGLANERAAEANARAEEARLETERLRSEFSWRVISASEMVALVTELSKSIGPVAIQYVEGDVESASYAEQFVFAFRTAGWSAMLQACTYAQLAFGLRAPEFHDERAGPSRSVRAALSLAGIKFESAPLFPHTMRGSLPRGPLVGGQSRPMDLFAEGSAQLYIGPKAPSWAFPDAELAREIASAENANKT